MHCVVFSTHRQIRDFSASHDNEILPKLYTIDEFMRRIVVVEGKKFVNEANRVLYLYKAVANIDIKALGFDKNFLSFVKNASFIFKFFEEIFAEQVDINSLNDVDTYGDFEDHLKLLKNIYDRYDALLQADGYVDRITIKDFRLNDNFLNQFSSIAFYVEGYLSRFEIGVLNEIEKPLVLHINVTPFSKRLLDRLQVEENFTPGYSYAIDWQEKAVLSLDKMIGIDNKKVDIAAFSQRMNQVAFVLKKVDDFIKDGALPKKIAVVVPDESFAEYLKLFDEAKNFNFAMGTPFVQSRYYRKLCDLYDALSDKSAVAKQKMQNNVIADRFAKVNDFESFVEFLGEVKAKPREMMLIDEQLFLFKRFKDLMKGQNPLMILHSWLQRLEPLSIDDIGGGKVTVMGVLESRGMKFDGVVIVDFNEEVVPKVGEKDLFLNSSIRRHAGMPTRQDKENLQKNYYYRVLQNSCRAAICYVKDEENVPSRFLRELGFSEALLQDEQYRSIITFGTNKVKLFDEPIKKANPFIKSSKLTPTRLKDYLVCKRRFYYKYVQKIVNDTAQKENFGSLIHASLEAAAKNKDIFLNSDDYYKFTMNHLYRSMTSLSQRFEAAVDWESKLYKFCEEDFDALKFSDQIVIEDWCNVKFANMQLSSKIDRADKSERSITLIDYKTTSKLKNTIEDENDFQLIFYALWARSLYPDLQIKTIYWDLFEGKKVEVDIWHKKESLARTIAEIMGESVIDFTKTDDLKACRWCDYQTACLRFG